MINEIIEMQHQLTVARLLIVCQKVTIVALTDRLTTIVKTFMFTSTIVHFTYIQFWK